MSKRARRKYTVEDKVRILEEAREPNTTVSGRVGAGRRFADSLSAIRL